ncbi:magnesium/cobalt transporter CorA [Suttonella sp. R2A3]|uniref:magnesium/cobalt transporter CorA n=1 Tax=Suttonella sp. R2A3 TaxID=2908648 RepID=UPI001F2B7788|nr:magnesium/cobalt transporter CorA [Suttonella sp. R2A3]UJF24039.1 magnesium/cobalt transporter CorA [Suttonella sp. R2A3]
MSQIIHTRYSEHDLERQALDPQASVLPDMSDGALHWLDFSGVPSHDTLSTLLAPLGIHELVLEDICNPRQQPKTERYDDALFLVSRALEYRESKLTSEAVSFLIKEHVVLTFRSGKIDVFAPMAARFDHSPRESEKLNAGFLAYSLLDCLVDDYFAVIEKLLDKIEQADLKLFSATGKNTLNKAHRLRLDTGKLRRSIRRTHDAVMQLMRSEHPLIDAHNKTYFRDVLDHSIQMLDTLEGANDTITSLAGTYLNIQSNQLNLQMRLLTVITILFMPLTVITGIYGMNFAYMPELQWRYAYFVVLGVMLSIVVVLLWLFRRKRWL